jgi:hypothetical protein
VTPAPPPPGRHRIWDLPEREAVEAVVERLTRVRRLAIMRTLHRAMYFATLERPGGTRPEPLYYAGSLAGRRYTPRGGPAGLYLAFDPSTPPAELRAVVFEHGFPVSSEPHDPIVTIAVRAVVRHVLDLTDPSTVEALDPTDANLTADWEAEQAGYLAAYFAILAASASIVACAGALVGALSRRRSQLQTRYSFSPDSSTAAPGRRCCEGSRRARPVTTWCPRDSGSSALPPNSAARQGLRAQNRDARIQWSDRAQLLSKSLSTAASCLPCAARACFSPSKAQPLCG